ncbi:ABC transporter permease [Capnocytophaga felis]|uniref:Permease n=1 Tax=Capnocytophaga felis TaxID=2267611 RepID=A0A5M4B8H9_9FLAO|nr:FtsX-like permease family protein [Capnocytophaga felis]GET45913.1 permease [Capnocytophaga felis]GET49235.1 permease [Capnocytophaga felis]
MAIVAIAVGVMMMLIAIATGMGLQRKIREKIVAFQGHIQIYNYDNNASQVSIKPISVHQDFYPKFSNIPEITHIQAVATKGGIVRTENSYEAILAKGVGKDYDWELMKEFIKEGRTPDFNAEEISNEILISEYFANRLQLKLGDNCHAIFLRDESSQMPNQRNFKIVGIYNSGFQEFDAAYIFTDIRQIQRINQWKPDEVGSFEVFIDDFDKIEEVGAKVYGQTVSHLDSQTIIQKYPFIFEWLGMFDFNIYLIIGIMIVVGGFNMITAILVLILEKTPMIGILKSLGATDKSIQGIFLYNATYIISLGLFWGNILGLLLLFLQQKYSLLKLDPDTYYVTEVPIYISPLIILLLNIGVLLLCLVILLLPTYVITKISPTKSMKFS